VQPNLVWNNGCTKDSLTPFSLCLCLTFTALTSRQTRSAGACIDEGAMSFVTTMIVFLL
jgi:hypothetical protein